MLLMISGATEGAQFSASARKACEGIVSAFAAELPITAKAVAMAISQLVFGNFCFRGRLRYGSWDEQPLVGGVQPHMEGQESVCRFEHAGFPCL